MKRFLMLCFAANLLFLSAACGACSNSDESVKVYTDKDIYIYSYECGCLRSGSILKTDHIIIETKEQLDYAIQNYSYLEASSTFKEMIEQYLIEDYTYMLRYDEVTSAGYYIHVDKVKIKDDAVCFAEDSKSHSPKSKASPQVMEGFFHMAAIPKEYLENCDYSGMRAVFPGEENQAE